MKTIDKVLFIDDEDIDRFLHSELLRKSGFARQVVSKSNGRSAIDYLKTECFIENNYPSLIFVDLYMPNGNGFEFLQEFEKLYLPNKHEIAVVVLSYTEKGDDIVKLHKLGRYHFEQKPLDTEKVENIFHRFFRNLQESNGQKNLL